MKNTLLLLSVFSLVLFSCKKEPKETTKPEFDKKSMLTNYSNNLIKIRYEHLKKELKELENNVNDFVATANTSNFSEVQNAFDATYLAWQSVSYFQFGPAENYVLKSVFNIFPVDTTKINNNIAAGNYVLGSASNIAAIGLPAMDYLLNTSDTEAGSLAYFTRSDSTQKKQYLQDIIQQLTSTLLPVVSDWQSEYGTSFVNADGASQGSSLSEMINALNLDFEKFIRDGKIGIPLGVRSLGTPLPQNSEAYFGKQSTELCKKAIKDLQTYFNGGTGLGLDDYLNHLDAKHGAGLLSDNINSQFNSIIKKLDALNGPISEQVITNQASVQEVYNEMQKMVVLLKVDLSSALSVLITYQDNDGD